MAKTYGRRWAIVDGPRLGSGGQGEVFRVRDITGQLEGEFALKRVPDINRRERFKRESLASPQSATAYTKELEWLGWNLFYCKAHEPV